MAGEDYWMAGAPDLEEGAAAHGICAAADAVESGMAHGLSPEEIARDAHSAAEEAYRLYLHLSQHAAVDDQAAGHAVENQPIVGQSMLEHRHHVGQTERRHHVSATAIERHVGHHGGGGGHGGHFHGGGWWGGPSVIYESPVVLYCGPGQILLADGTCFPPAAYGYQVGGPEVGDEQPPDGAHVLTPDEDGSVTFPDGTRIGLTPFIADAGVHVGQSGDNLGSAASATGVAPTGNSDVDTLATQYQMIGQVIAANSPPADMQAAWARDDNAWNGWLADFSKAGSVTQTIMLPALDAWHQVMLDWANAVRIQWPTATLPTNFPAGQGSPIGLYPSEQLAPSGSVLGGSGSWLSGLGSTMQWIVIAVAVGVGLWLFWPALVGARHLMGSP